MMDDLISRKAAIDQAMGRANYVDTIFDKPTESEIVYMLRSIPSVPAVPLDKLCVLLKELNESGYSFQCAFCKKAFPAWCDEKNTDIGWDEEFCCPTWEEITEWMVELGAEVH